MRFLKISDRLVALFFQSWARVALFLALFMIVGCSSSTTPVFDESEEPDYTRGKRYLNQGDREQALLSFLKVIDSRSDAAQSHLEVGILYLETMKQPVLAIYHFTRFLELRPNAREAHQVTRLIDTAKKEFARTLPGRPFESEVEQLDLMEMIERLRAENNSLKGRMQALEQENRTLRRSMDQNRTEARTTTPTQSPTTSTPPSQVTQYTVLSGDTLSSIARNVYGNSGRWEEIFQANRNILRSPNDLRVGQNLRIPR